MVKGEAAWLAAPASGAANLHRACSCTSTSACAHLAAVLTTLPKDSELLGEKEPECPQPVREAALT